MKHPWPVYAATSAGLFIFVFAVVNAGWQELVRYRIRDGMAFNRDISNGTCKHSLAGHRCFSAIYNKCFEDLPGEPRPNDDECVPPISNRCRCDHVAQTFCYTTFPVDCASWERDGKLQFDACDRIFPHGFKHFKELLVGN